VNAIERLLKELDEHYNDPLGMVSAARADLAAITDALTKLDTAIVQGDLVWKRKRQSDTEPYHPANVALTKALRVIRGEQDD
jgi:hypothetical protein